jgi:hypothetical protein
MMSKTVIGKCVKWKLKRFNSEMNVSTELNMDASRDTVNIIMSYRLETSLYAYIIYM